MNNSKYHLNTYRSEVVEELFQQEFISLAYQSYDRICTPTGFDWLDLHSPNVNNFEESINELNKLGTNFSSNFKLTLNTSHRKEIITHNGIETIKTNLNSFDCFDYKSISDLSSKYHLVSLINRFHVISINEIAEHLHSLINLLNLENDTNCIYISDYSIKELRFSDEEIKDYINFQNTFGAVFFPESVISMIIELINKSFGELIQTLPTSNEEYWAFSIPAEAVKESLFCDTGPNQDDKITEAKKSFNQDLKRVLGYNVVNEDKGYLSKINRVINSYKGKLDTDFKDFTETAIGDSKNILNFFHEVYRSDIETIKTLQAFCWKINSELVYIK